MGHCYSSSFLGPYLNYFTVKEKHYLRILSLFEIKILVLVLKGCVSGLGSYQSMCMSKSEKDINSYFKSMEDVNLNQSQDF